MKRHGLCCLVVLCTIFIYGCRSNESTEFSSPIPSGIVTYFQPDSQKVVKIFSSKQIDLEPLSETEKSFIGDYFKKYTSNPRLNETEKNLLSLINGIDSSYYLYQTHKDSVESDDITYANQGLEAYFKFAKYFDEDGNFIGKG